jgi:hypothetical protein
VDDVERFIPAGVQINTFLDDRRHDATHLIFISNEEDVLREMNAFIAGLHKLP